MTPVPFLRKHSGVLTVCLAAIGCARVAATYTALSVTSDEPSHLACGMEYLSRHVYRYETQHPPLARVMAALGPFLAGSRTVGKPAFDQEGVAILRESHVPIRTTALMRAGILPFFVLGCAVVWIWARRDFGPATAVLAVALFTLLPPVLADAGLGTTDMAVAACLGLAFLTMMMWAESPTWQRSLLFGLGAALAALAKFSALLFFPCAAALALICYLAAARPSRVESLRLLRERAAPFALAVVAGAVVIWGAYRFSFGTPQGWSFAVPAPEFFDGIQSVQRHNQSGHIAYLFGWVSRTGWWYYFPAALALKTPIPFLLLLGAGSMAALSKWRKPTYLMPPAFCAGILLPAMAGNVNIGIRHVLPVYLGFSILAAIALLRLPDWLGKRAGTIAGLLLLALMALSGILQHPDYLAYFNAFAGDSPEKVLSDSNYDWGQSLPAVARRLRQLNVGEVSFFALDSGIPADDLRAWYGMPRIRPLDLTLATRGWYVVSPFLLEATSNRFTHLTPAERVGSDLLYYIPGP
jgi:hypothetical protein